MAIRGLTGGMVMSRCYCVIWPPNLSARYTVLAPSMYVVIISNFQMNIRIPNWKWLNFIVSMLLLKTKVAYNGNLYSKNGYVHHISHHGWLLVGDQCWGSAPARPGLWGPALCPHSPESTLSSIEIKDGVASLSESGGSTVLRAKTERKNLNAPLLTMSIWDLMVSKSSSVSGESMWVIISPCYWSIRRSSLHASLVCDLSEATLSSILVRNKPWLINVVVI